MIILGDCILSDEIYEEQFVCDLPVCKGGCCVEGDAGAPLTQEETLILGRIVSRLVPYMIPEGLAAIDRQGYWVEDAEGELTTPLVEGRQCAYVFFDDSGIAKCAIEKAWEQGLIDFQKPISCHLYPIRVKKYPHYEALNYHRWPLCDCARAKGKKTAVRVYRFLKDALIRKYGVEWYGDLEAYISYVFEHKK
ncbi:MAG: DUF3109 family protein [Bacteroidia bacterium]|nr:MAG: DUF3109 family protein [Bacteroidia bacterium]